MTDSWLRSRPKARQVIEVRTAVPSEDGRMTVILPEVLAVAVIPKSGL